MAKEWTAAEIKAECERIWRDAAIPPETMGARAIWSIADSRLVSRAGAPTRIPMGETWSRNNAKMRAHYGPPAPPNYKESGALYCPKTTRERYRERYPNNWRALVAGYGKLDSLSDKGEAYHQALKAPSLPGLLSAEIAREAEPPATAAPAIDPETMSDEALEAAAAPILADVARELSKYVANVRADLKADATREAAPEAAECPPAAPEPVATPEPPKAASARRRPSARRSRDMAPRWGWDTIRSAPLIIWTP